MYTYPWPKTTKYTTSVLLKVTFQKEQSKDLSVTWIVFSVILLIFKNL